MTAKLWGGILVGVFVVAAGMELARRRCPGLTEKASAGARKVLESTDENIKKFSSSAMKAFQEGYTSVTA